jgi:hypothetical protein
MWILINNGKIQNVCEKLPSTNKWGTSGTLVVKQGWIMISNCNIIYTDRKIMVTTNIERKDVLWLRNIFVVSIHSLKFSCEITAFIPGNCVLCCFNSEFTKKKINKIIYKTGKNANISVIILVLFVILLIFFVNPLVK